MADLAALGDDPVKLKAEIARLRAQLNSQSSKQIIYPDGVDFDSLQDEKAAASPEKAERAYSDALHQLGGPSHLKPFVAKMTQLVKYVEDHHASKTQHHAWQPFPLSTFIDSITTESIRELGITKLSRFQSLLKAQNIECELTIASPKGLERADSKVIIKYDGDVSKLVDVNRATIGLKDSEDLMAAVQLAVEAWDSKDGCVIGELEDKYFGSCMQHGYRHVQMIVQFVGICWEVQFNTFPFLHAKHDFGHTAYKTMRYIHEMVLYYAMKDDTEKLKELLSHPGVDEVADPNLVKDRRGMRAIHHAAFRGNLTMAKLLLGLRKKPRFFLMDKEGELPLGLAVISTKWTLAETLCDNTEKEMDKLSSADITPNLLISLKKIVDASKALGQSELALKVQRIFKKAQSMLPAEIVELRAEDWGKLTVPDGHFVLRAFFGHSENPWKHNFGMDVTKTVREKCNGGGTLVGKPFAQLFGDCQSGIGKNLFAKACRDPTRTIFLSGFDDQVQTVQAGEWSALLIPHGMKIRRAFYGSNSFPWDDSRGANVTEIVKSLVDGSVGKLRRTLDGCLLEGGMGTFFGDPAPGMSKSLFVELERL